MLILDEDSFKKQIKILYYSKMPQVAQTYFEQGFKDTSIASALLVPVAAVARWRTLYLKGALLENADSEKSVFPFDKGLGNASWTDFPYDIKRVAKAFFEMGLRCRAISFYLDVPISTVYFWFGLFKKNQFETEPPLPQTIKPYEVSGEKFTPHKNKRRYTYEVRQVAKECFLKGMSITETARFLEISPVTISRWKRQLVEGTFYVNQKEKALLAHTCQDTRKAPTSRKAPTLVDRNSAKELFDVGATDLEIAMALNISMEIVQFWHDLYRKGEFNDSLVLGSQIVKDGLKTATGVYKEEVRQAAKECFDSGYGYKLTAKFLGIPPTAVKEWKRLYDEGRFFVKIK